jgi:hypothetical protein
LKGLNKQALQESLQVADKYSCNIHADIQLTKNTGKPHIIKYIRDNGTPRGCTVMIFLCRHDLSHYAIETIIGYATAFNGMLNGGMDIKDFENREKRMAMQVTAEALYAENMSNLFLTEILQGEFEDFNAVQQQSRLGYSE